MPRGRRTTPVSAPGGAIVAKRITSGLKDLRRSAKRRVANTGVRSRLKTLMRGASSSPDLLAEAQAALDKAAARGVIHPNAAARRKSRLMRGARSTP
ncbi:MAG: 30S ribosomal protein S20 [bacterium]